MLGAHGERQLRLLVTVSFNPNQLRSHLLPLIGLPEVASITLVSDAEPPMLDKVTSVVPSRKAVRLLGRAGSKLALCAGLARREQFDWVLGYNFVPHGFNARVAARVGGTRSLYHMIGGELEWRGGGHGSENNVLGRLRRPHPRLERLLLGQIARCTRIATLGPGGRQALIDAGIDPDRVIVVPPSVDTERYRPQENLSPKWDVVTVGRLSPLKRTADLLDAVARLRLVNPDLRVAIAGDGELRDELRGRIRTLGIEGNVELLGAIDNVEDLYAQSRAFVLTSAFEGLPIAMLDAMAAGLPVVTSNVGEIATVVDHGITGLLYPCGDIDTLTRELVAVLSDREDIHAMSAAGQRLVAERYSVAAVATIYRNLLDLPVA